MDARGTGSGHPGGVGVVVARDINDGCGPPSTAEGPDVSVHVQVGDDPPSWSRWWAEDNGDATPPFPDIGTPTVVPLEAMNRNGREPRKVRHI